MPWDMSRLVQDPQQVKNFPRAFRGKVRSSTQRRKQRAEEVMGLLQFAESHACLDRRQMTAALRIQNPRLWLEYTQNRCAAYKHISLCSCWATVTSWRTGSMFVFSPMEK